VVQSTGGFLKNNAIIYDPFVGSGTTGFLANYLGYDFVGSDIEIKYVDQNLARRKTSKFNNPNKDFKIFHHDINIPRPSKQPEENF